MEVNWNPSDSKTNECKLIKLTFPNGESSLVKREHLNAIMFTMGTEEEQRQLTPQTLTRIRNYETTLGITAKKDIRKGEKINVHVKIPIPLSQEDVLAMERKEKTIII